MPPTQESIVADYFNNMPHPLAPSVRVGDYASAARMASAMTFGGEHPGPQAVENFWHEYQAMNGSLLEQGKQPLAPEEFTHLVQQLATSSFAYHNRPPSMYEIATLRDAHPKDVRTYYGSMPDRDYPTVSAHQMAQALATAAPWAREHLGRAPTKGEAHYIAHSGHGAQDYYGHLGAEEEALKESDGGVTGPA